MDCSPPGSSVHSPGKNTGVGRHALLQKIFPTQGLNLGLLHCKQILYHLSYRGVPISIYPSLFSLCPIPRLQVVTEHRAKRPMSHSSSWLALCFARNSVSIYVSAPLCVHPTLPFPTVSTSPFSLSASLFLP